MYSSPTSEDWHPISRNFAVTAGDNLWVSDGGRAELDVGGLQFWLAGGANVYFEQFDDFAVVARLTQGAMIVRVRAMESGDATRVLLPQGSWRCWNPALRGQCGRRLRARLSRCADCAPRPRRSGSGRCAAAGQSW